MHFFLVKLGFKEFRPIPSVQSTMTPHRAHTVVANCQQSVLHNLSHRSTSRRHDGACACPTRAATSD